MAWAEAVVDLLKISRRGVIRIELREVYVSERRNR